MIHSFHHQDRRHNSPHSCFLRLAWQPLNSTAVTNSSNIFRIYFNFFFVRGDACVELYHWNFTKNSLPFRGVFPPSWMKIRRAHNRAFVEGICAYGWGMPAKWTVMLSKCTFPGASTWNKAPWQSFSIAERPLNWNVWKLPFHWLQPIVLNSPFTVTSSCPNRDGIVTFPFRAVLSNASPCPGVQALLLLGKIL